MALSDTSRQSYAAQIASPARLGGALIAGLMLGVFAFTAQHGRIVQVRPAALVLTETPALAVSPAPVLPPQAQAEAQMSSTELMGRWDGLIAAASQRFHVPAAWIRNVMRMESGGRTWLNGQPITSDRGAQGLMQLLPGTFAEMRAQYGLSADIFDPRSNIFAGAAYLRWLHGKYGYPAMFAAYNDGPGRLEDHLHHGHPLPAETRAYVASITRALGRGGEWLANEGRLTLTRPDGSKVTLARAKIHSVRAALAGEYPPQVAAVIDLGKTRQGVRENPAAVLAMLGKNPA